MADSAPRNRYTGYRHPFLFGVAYLGGVGDNPRTLSELAMSQLSAEIRRQPEWWKIYQNRNVRKQWSEYALRRAWNIRTPSSNEQVRLSAKQIDYILDELSGYAALRDAENKCEVSCFERIWESNSLLDSSTLIIFHDELSVLRKQIQAKKQRDGNGVTLALIDPLLHCFVYAKTLVSYPFKIPRLLPPPPSETYTVSPHFCVLPSSVYVSPSGSVKFTSYINNLHQENTTLYKHIETALAGFIPLFEHTLTDLHRNNPLSQRIPGPCRYIVWDEPDPPEHSDDEEGWSAYERDMRHWVLNRPIRLPDVPDIGYTGGLEHRKHVVTLRGRNLQFIVGVSETRPQPGGPPYVGSPWHVEGMKNERIVACGYYYISSENIANSSLEFRIAITCPRGFSAGDTGATLRTWGLQDGDSCHQYIGSVPIRAGLGIVFPNIYQHRQTGFELVDPLKEGHQIVLSFFLIDPDIQPIVSTAVVAPQQKEWIRKAVNECLDIRLPVEMVEKIMDGVEGLMEEDEAESYRNDLLQVRDTFRKDNDEYHFCIPFNIWNVIS